MAKIRNEEDFQKWTEAQLGAIGHVQSHRFSHYPHIPDMSVSANGVDMWLELKYGEFNLAGGRQGRSYDRFRFKETTRQQLDWLIRRTNSGRALCGILGFFDTLPLREFQYVFFMPAAEYLERIHEGEMNTGAGILLKNTEAFGYFKTPELLANHIYELARPVRRP